MLSDGAAGKLFPTGDPGPASGWTACSTTRRRAEQLRGTRAGPLVGRSSTPVVRRRCVAVDGTVRASAYELSRTRRPRPDPLRVSRPRVTAHDPRRVLIAAVVVTVVLFVWVSLTVTRLDRLHARGTPPGPRWTQRWCAARPRCACSPRTPGSGPATRPAVLRSRRLLAPTTAPRGRRERPGPGAARTCRAAPHPDPAWPTELHEAARAGGARPPVLQRRRTRHRVASPPADAAAAAPGGPADAAFFEIDDTKAVPRASKPSLRAARRHAERRHAECSIGSRLPAGGDRRGAWRRSSSPLARARSLAQRQHRTAAPGPTTAIPTPRAPTPSPPKPTPKPKPKPKPGRPTRYRPARGAEAAGASSPSRSMTPRAAGRRWASIARTSCTSSRSEARADPAGRGLRRRHPRGRPGPQRPQATPSCFPVRPIGVAHSGGAGDSLQAVATRSSRGTAAGRRGRMPAGLSPAHPIQPDAGHVRVAAAYRTAGKAKTSDLRGRRLSQAALDEAAAAGLERRSVGPTPCLRFRLRPGVQGYVRVIDGARQTAAGSDDLHAECRRPVPATS